MYQNAYKINSKLLTCMYNYDRYVISGYADIQRIKEEKNKKETESMNERIYHFCVNKI